MPFLQLQNLPFRSQWGYIVGAILMISGISIVPNRLARAAAAFLGVAIAVVVRFIYPPMHVVAA